MCYVTTCKTCSKPTWGGCGAHIEAALAKVPKSERCRCREQASAKGAAGTGGVTAASTDAPAPRRKLFGLF